MDLFCSCVNPMQIDNALGLIKLGVDRGVKVSGFGVVSYATNFALKVFSN